MEFDSQSTGMIDARAQAHEHYIWPNGFLIAFVYLLLFAVKKRIDRTQSRLDKLSNQELLLEAGHALRIEKDRQKELESQLEHQMQDIQRANTVIQRALGSSNKLMISEMKIHTDQSTIAKRKEKCPNEFAGIATGSDYECDGWEDAGCLHFEFKFSTLIWSASFIL